MQFFLESVRTEEPAKELVGIADIIDNRAVGCIAQQALVAGDQPDTPVLIDAKVNVRCQADVFDASIGVVGVAESSASIPKKASM